MRKFPILTIALLLGLSFLCVQNPVRAELMVKGIPATFMLNPSPTYITVEGSFQISFSESEKKIMDEAVQNKNEMQSFIVLFPTQEKDIPEVNARDGIITKVELKPIKGNSVVLTLKDDGKAVQDFQLSVVGPNKWVIATAKDKNTPFIEHVNVYGYFQKTGDKVIKLSETLQPKGGPILTAFGQVTGKIIESEVVITHPSRGNDRVVSAKDANLGLPGGTKVLHVKAPNGVLFDLTIERLAGEKGSALFQEDKNKFVKELKGKKGEFDFTIKGENLSDRPRNMAVIATDVVTKKVLGSLTFTVFQVNQELVNAKDIADIPGFQKANAFGDGGQPKLLIRSYKSFAESTKLGIHLSTKGGIKGGSQVYGGVVFRGTIKPTGMEPMDFNRVHNRFTAFNWERKLSARTFDGSGCYNKQGKLIHLNVSDEVSDNLGDEDDKDLLPDPDDQKQPKELYMWAIDAPNLLDEDIGGIQKTASVRFQFSKQQIFYDKASCSNTIQWFFRASIEFAKNGGIAFTNQYSPNDNQVKEGVTELSVDLQDSNIKFAVEKAAPVIFTNGKHTDLKAIEINIEGKGLKPKVGKIDAKNCQYAAYAIRETHSETDTYITVFPPRTTKAPFGIDITDIAVDKIKGEIRYFSGTLSRNTPYVLKIFIFDKAATVPQPITVAP